MSYKVLELNNGYLVPAETYNSLCEAAASLLEKKDIPTILSLVRKCQNAGFEFIPSKYGDAKAILKQYHLIDDNDDVHEDIRQLVLSGIEEAEGLLHINIPMKNGSVATITINKV